MPFVADRARTMLANQYVPARDYKAFAVTVSGVFGYALAQTSEEVAKTTALEQCQKRADTYQPQRQCELYAVGDRMVYQHGSPPLPPTPWIRHDPSTERPFAVKDVPLVREQGKTRLESIYVPGRKSKSLAIGPIGQFFFNSGLDSVEETTRRNLETCGAVVSVACMIVAVDDVFVVPVPSLMKATGFFHAASNSSIIANARDDVARQLVEASSGWNAVAVGTTGRPGLGLRQNSEQNAINDALANCVKHDGDCHVIAIGPFTVDPN
jgi:hypothetical protein